MKADGGSCSFMFMGTELSCIGCRSRAARCDRCRAATVIPSEARDLARAPGPSRVSGMVEKIPRFARDDRLERAWLPLWRLCRHWEHPLGSIYSLRYRTCRMKYSP